VEQLADGRSRDDLHQTSPSTALTHAPDNRGVRQLLFYSVPEAKTVMLDPEGNEFCLG
jgi:hypothetical protein